MNAVLTNRVFGLDILRTVAIIIVVISHSSINLIEEHGLVYLPDGVDLFFVLSGYLIGKILITTAQQTGGFNISATLNFIQRRWFRTLPNYFLFLIINIILIYFGSIQGTLNKYLVTFFVFFQNFSKPYDFLFWESWSLSIEEWFYLSFPLLLMLMFQITKFKRKVKLVFIFSILVFLICPLLYRIGFTNKSLDYDLYCRKLVLTRLDTIGFGLLGAYFKTYYSSTWLKYKNQAFFAGLVLLFLLLSSSSTNHFFKWTFYYTIMGAGILFLLPKLESLTIEKIPLKPFQFISKISFSIYLLHLPLQQLLIKSYEITNIHEAIFIYFLYWVLLLFLSWLIYCYFEKPVMNLRNHKRIIKLFEHYK